MKKLSVALILCFLLQILFSVYGSKLVSYKTNPFLILVVSVAVPVLAFFIIRMKNRAKMVENSSEIPVQNSNLTAWLFAFSAMLPMILAYEELRKMWVKFPDPVKISDVIPQLAAQNKWFWAGETPNQLVSFPTYQAFPVYMPLHWMPIQVAELTGLDLRWVGAGFMMLSFGVAAFFMARSTANLKNKWSAALLFWLMSLPIWAFIVWNPLEIGVSFELVVVAWYVLLAAGLVSKNYWLIGIGVVGTLLSRYTDFFWMPTLAVLLWQFEPKKSSFWLWGSAVAAILLIYVFPIYLPNPTALMTGIKYHNNIALNGWSRTDDECFSQGLNFAMHLRLWLPGVPEKSLFLCRLLQGLIMTGVFAAGVFFYIKKWKNEMSWHVFSLLSLQMVLVLFFLSSPMTFQYYLLVPMTTAAMICYLTMNDEL